MLKRTDLVALLISALLAALLLTPTIQHLGRIYPGRNLVEIARAGAQYQADNANRLPFVMTYQRGIDPPPGGGGSEGLCNWAWGGKNNDGSWASRTGGLFDVEAADRPLNKYLYAWREFYAPPPPQRLPPNDPARQDQATIFREPRDMVSYQRMWPRPEPIASYDDVGTSFLSNMLPPWSQLYSREGWSFRGALAECNRLIANGERLSPARFVWMSDQVTDVVANGGRNNVVNGYGDTNKAPLLFLDGHLTYETIEYNKFQTATYDLIFQPRLRR